MHSFSLPIKCVTKTKLIYATKTDNRAVSEGGGGGGTFPFEEARFTSQASFLKSFTFASLMAAVSR